MRGKYNLAALILKEANCRGHEAVLDIGTGTGLLAASAAKKLSSGTVTSLTGGDLSPPEMALVLRNFMAEEVDARVQILEGDCRASRFEDAAFDVAVSLMGLSDCVASEEDLVDTCHEIIRMLRPRGLVVVAASASDTKAISMALMKAGARVLPPQNCWLHAYIPAYIVKARKPA
jgi:ubiquinone/menaquinone biosynthesis C-methylase UbiE